MCYYNGVKVSREEYIRLKDLKVFVAKNRSWFNCDLNQGPLYNQPYPVLKASDDGIQIKQMEWGYLPEENRWPFIKSREEVNKFRTMYTTLNAMSETLLVNEQKRPSMFAEAAQYRRCLVPSTGYWEWRHVKQMGKRGKILKDPIKIPYHIVVNKQNDDHPFYMAGIYSTWIDEQTGEMVDTAAIVTAVATELSANVHNIKKRMPTILDEDLAYEWMFGKLSKDDMMDIAKTQYPSAKMDAWTVSKRFLNEIDPRAKFEYRGLPPLGSDEPYNPNETLTLF